MLEIHRPVFSYRQISSILLIISLLACAGEEPSPEPAPEPSATKVTAEASPRAPQLPRSQTLDQAARFLAGFEPLGALPPTHWDQHADEMAILWRELESRRLDQMRSWAEGELRLRNPKAPLIYPFGGPDFLSANRFFPTVQSLVLIGLEPPGEVWIPQADAGGGELDPRASEDLATALERLRGGFRSLLDAGYFVTRRMEEDLAGTHLNGVLPVLLMFLAHQGFTIEEASYVELGADGSFNDIRPENASTATALRIAFQAGDSEPKTLYYVSQDLSNQGFDTSPLKRHLESLNGFNVYMKSAQYLIHGEMFSSLREVLVANALDVLQDDSGIPLRDFGEATWRRTFFGVYTRTLPAYREYFQPELAKAYRVNDAQPLDFALGYNTDIGGSCLIWAQRRSEPGE